MKTYPNKELAPQWAHDLVPSGTNGGDTFYFTGDTIYSYGDHFPIAKRVSKDEREGQINFLVGTGKYSNKTTEKHVWLVRGSTYGMVIQVKNVEANSKEEHKDNYLELTERILLTKRSLDALSVLKWAHKKKFTYLKEAEKLIKQANTYTKYYKLGYQQITTRSQGIDEQLEEMERYEKEEEKSQLAECKQSMDNWLLNQSQTGDVKPYDFPHQMVRYNQVTDQVETSWGVKFDKKFAADAWDLVNKCRDKHKKVNFPKGRLMMGSYSVDHITAEGDMKAGYNYIKYQYASILADQLGLTIN